MTPGSACTNSIFLFAVMPPKIPAATTQHRKKILTGSPAVPSQIPQIKPAARKPLYKPWFAASTFDCAENSGVRPNALRPFGVSHKNISRYRI
ncbi:Hypothetical protein mma_1697 [Janthinobacterium sp. Marseille]|nr:Hypothetical protein mma_1697 [Janthinobacterium sp. Marseille]